MDNTTLATLLSSRFSLRRCRPQDAGIYIEYANGFSELLTTSAARKLLGLDA